MNGERGTRWGITVPPYIFFPGTICAAAQGHTKLRSRKDWGVHPLLSKSSSLEGIN